jgi:hypothetical protein
MPPPTTSRSHVRLLNALRSLIKCDVLFYWRESLTGSYDSGEAENRRMILIGRTLASRSWFRSDRETGRYIGRYILSERRWMLAGRKEVAERAHRPLHGHVSKVT